jgi:hypothetical protein
MREACHATGIRPVVKALKQMPWRLGMEPIERLMLWEGRRGLRLSNPGQMPFLAHQLSWSQTSGHTTTSRNWLWSAAPLCYEKSLKLLPRLISCISTVTLTPHPLRSRPRDRTMNLMGREFRYRGEHFFVRPDVSFRKFTHGDLNSRSRVFPTPPMLRKGAP